MTTLTKRWDQPLRGILMTESGNTTTQLQNYLFNLKNGLVSSTVGPWEVLASSGGGGGARLSAGLTDLWTVPADIFIGYPDDAAARAWSVLKSPISPLGPYYMILDCWATSSLTTYQMQVYFTKSEPDLSSFSVSARPAPTGYEWSHATVTPWSSDADVFSHNCSLVTAHDGSFVLFGNRTGHPYMTSAWMFNVMNYDTLKAADGVGAVSLIWGESSAKMTQPNLPRFRGLHPLDGAEIDLAACTLLANDTKVLDGMAEDTVTQRHLGLPVWVFATSSGKESLRGRLEDIHWAPDRLHDSYPSYVNNVFEGIKVGPFWVPTEEAPRI